MLSYREACEVADFGEVQRYSSGDEDEVPITDLLKALKDKVETVMPEGASSWCRHSTRFRKRLRCV